MPSPPSLEPVVGQGPGPCWKFVPRCGLWAAAGLGGVVKVQYISFPVDCYLLNFYNSENGAWLSYPTLGNVLILSLHRTITTLKTSASGPVTQPPLVVYICVHTDVHSTVQYKYDTTCVTRPHFYCGRRYRCCVSRL
jgi:hypothetical protein